MQEYKDLVSLRKTNVRKLNNVQKKINRLKRDINRLREVEYNLIDINTKNKIRINQYTRKIHNTNICFDYIIRCIDWLNKNHLDDLKISDINKIIELCHRKYHDKLLKGFRFTLDRECSVNGCMSWTYGNTHCSCKKTQISYDKTSINYITDIHLDDKHPLYKICF